MNKDKWSTVRQHYIVAAYTVAILISPKILSVKELTMNNGDNDSGATALHIAAQEGHLDVTKYLISQGAEVNNGR